MVNGALDGNKYDHSMKNLVRVLLICILALFAVGFSLAIWDLARPSGVISPLPFVLLFPAIPGMVIAFRPRWQLGADALWQLRRTKTAIAPYASIEAVRVIKSRKDGSKIFEIATSQETFNVDVLQGDAFERPIQPGRRIKGSGFVDPMLVS